MTQSMYRLIPKPQPTDAATIYAAAHKANDFSLHVGSKAAQEFCAKFSHTLLNDPRTRSYPELAVLGFWLRPASLQAMLGDLASAPATTHRMPVGIVFHIPPRNVDTLFLYPAMIALLCGNVSIIRLPSTMRPMQPLLLDMLYEALETAPDNIRHRFIFVRYGHEDEITAALSSLCNLRLVWGGDATINHLRRIPLSPLARNIGFGDRFSASVLNAAHYSAAPNTTRETLIHNFYNDMYWFDQLACASPRLAVWIGNATLCKESEQDFNQRLAAYAAQRGYQIDAGASLAKTTTSHLALHDLNLADYKIHGAALTTLCLTTLEKFSAFKHVNYGFGTLVTAHLPSLEAFGTFAETRDQTLTHWGFSPDDIGQWAQQSLGRGYDRIVPVGEATAFDALWDGHNLFDIMTRLVRVKT